jgi:hypothetical protein
VQFIDFSKRIHPLSKITPHIYPRRRFPALLIALSSNVDHVKFSFAGTQQSPLAPIPFSPRLVLITISRLQNYPWLGCLPMPDLVAVASCQIASKTTSDFSSGVKRLMNEIPRGSLAGSSAGLATEDVKVKTRA